MDIKFLNVLENEIATYFHRGSKYSLVNSDWTINLKYLMETLYHGLFRLYILL